MFNQVKEILERDIRPLLAMHAGDAELIAVEDGVVKLRLKGTCHGCMLSEVTLKAGVEQLLKSKLDGIKSVEAVE
ncbi:MAG: NifU family protein [Candidatus Niyogibacteria bacterium]|nr:NifU family protein [Candidatus Niyogibacteria bacterium]